MNVVFRADASQALGVGHVMRCANLAQALRARGADVRFICRPLAGHQLGLLRERGFAVDALDSPADDAAGTRATLAQRDIDWLVVDHYDLGEDWERALRPDVGQVMAIDDLPARRHDCDLLLDQNASGRSAEDFAGRVPERCALALGPRYALLGAEYAALRATRERGEGALRRVLVSFGGSDPRDLTGLALAALSRPEFAALEADIVAGANYPFLDRLQSAAARRPGTRVLGPQPGLAPLLANADLAIGAGGTTTWERLCLGVPAIVICMAENQRAGCEHLAAQSLIDYCGAAPQVDEESLVRALRRCTGDTSRLRDMAARGRALVDGLGAPRIAEYLWPSASAQLILRRARGSDVFLYYDWVNDAEVRRQSVQTGAIEFSGHRRWFDARLANAGSHLFVMQAGDLPVGQIRFDVTEGEAHIDYSIDRLFRGRGWARQLLALGMRALPAGTRFRAEVRPGNPASCAVFEQAGYRALPAPGPSGLRVFVHEGLPCAS